MIILFNFIFNLNFKIYFFIQLFKDFKKNHFKKVIFIKVHFEITLCHFIPLK